MNTMFQVTAQMAEELIAFPPFIEAVSEIDYCIRYFRETGRIRHTVIIGETGAGKSTLCEALLTRYPMKSMPERDIRPVVVAQAPTPCTQRALMGAILRSLGDPLPLKGSVEAQKDRIYLLAKAQRVELIIVDECQAGYERGEGKTRYAVADLLRDVFDAIGIPGAFVGLPHVADLIHCNEALRRRVHRRLSLQLQDSADCRTTLLQAFYSLGSLLPLDLTTDPFSRGEFSQRLWYATDGRIGFLKRLFTESIRVAHEASETHVNALTMGRAFRQTTLFNATDELDPFHRDFCFRRLDRRAEPFEPSYVSASVRRREE